MNHRMLIAACLLLLIVLGGALIVMMRQRTVAAQRELAEANAQLARARMQAQPINQGMPK